MCFLHKATGQAAVKLGGRFVYLGAWGSEQAQAAYLRVTGRWRASGRVVVRGAVLTVDRVLAGYWQHAQVYYRKDGVTTSEVMAIRRRLPSGER
ncbi:MAG: hypothetical protein WCR59_13005 [Planctomycetota bacterium]